MEMFSTCLTITNVIRIVSELASKLLLENIVPIHYKLPLKFTLGGTSHVHNLCLLLQVDIPSSLKCGNNHGFKGNIVDITEESHEFILEQFFKLHGDKVFSHATNVILFWHQLLL
jgi:hypothetical protein